MSGVLRFTILGSGSSGGVPRVGGDWGACDPQNPKNRRTRGSLLVERKAKDAPWGPETTTTVLIDTSPDMREQLLRADVRRLDAVLLTHDHADQTHGIDDLRAFWMIQDRRRVPVHMNEATASVITQRFDYCFVQPEGSPYPPIADACVDLTPGATVSVEGPGGAIDALVLDQDHGYVRSLGFRIGPAAYSNDVVDLPEESFAALSGLELWIVDALQEKPHKTHAHVDKTLGWIARLTPRRAVLTNMHQSLDFAALSARLPEGVEPAYDGMRIELEV